MCAFGVHLTYFVDFGLCQIPQDSGRQLSFHAFFMSYCDDRERPIMVILKKRQFINF